MADNVLQRAHSYTLIKPGSSHKVVVRRGQTIDNLDTADQQYLSRKTISPPIADDSHAPVGRIPLFGPLVDADVKGQAAVESVIDTLAESRPTTSTTTTTEPVTVRVEVSATDGLDATVQTTTEGAAAGGADTGGGATAEVTTPTTRADTTTRKTRKPSAKKQ